MPIGIVILAHEHLHRTRQVARALASKDCKVVIHVDSTTDHGEFESLRAAFRKSPHVAFADRTPCEWGQFSLVEAGLKSARMMLDRWPTVTHVIQISGSCIPLRPISELRDHLATFPDTDFAESVPADEDRWVKDGLSEERFTLHFPFSWKRQRFLFDLAVKAQRFLNVRRKPPCGLRPHLGSQWWCLTRDTLTAILEDQDKRAIDRYFKGCWIPDEGYIPTMVRRHSRRLNTRSLTLSRFDDQGKPHLFYDDHQELLQQTDYFFARKIWHGSDRLYRQFAGKPKSKPSAERPPSHEFGIDLLFDQASERRCHGRPGRVNVGRFPAAAFQTQPSTCVKYTVFVGFTHIWHGFENWVEKTTGYQTHGRLFKSNEVQFANQISFDTGAVPNNPKIRDTNPEQFLCNVLWNSRPERSAMMFDIADGKRMAQFFANDRNAQIIGVRGGWIIDLFQRPRNDLERTLQNARRLFRYDAAMQDEIAKTGRNDVTWLELGGLLGDLSGSCEKIHERISPQIRLRPRVLPVERDLTGLREFVALLESNGIDCSALGPVPATLPGEGGGALPEQISAVS